MARQINALIRQGYRYREIAVVTGAVEAYQSYMDPVLRNMRFHILWIRPKKCYFIRSLNVFVPRLKLWIRILVMRQSCAFCGVDSVILRRTIWTGWTVIWLQPVSAAKRRGADDGGICHGRKRFTIWNSSKTPGKIYGYLEPFAAVFARKDARVSDGIRALYQLLTQLDTQHQLWNREQQLLAQGEETRSREYAQIYTIVMQLLEKYNLLLGEEPLQIRDFTEVLEAGLSAADVAVIPPGYDSVTIGDIERTRLNHIRILFFIGVNDGIIPKAANAGGIISEYERELLAEKVELAPGAREQAFIQRFYLYRNLTKPSEKLYVSYAKVDSEGKAIRPSYLTGVLRKLFPTLKLQEPEHMEAHTDFYTQEAAEDYLVFGPHEEAWYALARWFLQENDMQKQEKIRKLLHAPYTRYEGEPISRAVALALYGRHPYGSITRLERFAACAYAHFLQYGLKLAERETSTFESVDMGNIYHTALERYSRKLEQSEYDWFVVPDAVRRQMAENAMQEAIAGYPGMAVCDTAENAYQRKRMLAIFDQTVWALTRQVRAGQFVPEKFEVTFDELEGKESLEYRLSHDVTMRLEGRIDRLDTFEDEIKFRLK